MINNLLFVCLLILDQKKLEKPYVLRNQRAHVGRSSDLLGGSL
jgi:hypothetical protein